MVLKVFLQAERRFVSIPSSNLQGKRSLPFWGLFAPVHKLVPILTATVAHLGVLRKIQPVAIRLIAFARSHVRNVKIIKVVRAAVVCGDAVIITVNLAAVSFGDIGAVRCHSKYFLWVHGAIDVFSAVPVSHLGLDLWDAHGVRNRHPCITLKEVRLPEVVYGHHNLVAFLLWVKATLSRIRQQAVVL